MPNLQPRRKPDDPRLATDCPTEFFKILNERLELYRHEARLQRQQQNRMEMTTQPSSLIQGLDVAGPLGFPSSRNNSSRFKKEMRDFTEALKAKYPDAIEDDDDSQDILDSHVRQLPGWVDPSPIPSGTISPPRSGRMTGCRGAAGVATTRSKSNYKKK